MKKIFQLQKENKNPDRILESVKNEIRKYLKRERAKALPAGATYWDFECQFGVDEVSAESVKTSELTAALDKARAADWSVCFVKIVATPVTKAPKETAEI